jgi:hypothetical protein
MATYPGITARFKLDNPDQAAATLTVTMKVHQWRDIANQLSAEAYESWPLRLAICDLVREAEKVFYHRVPEE